MLISVSGPLAMILWKRNLAKEKRILGVRHIQFISVGLIVPTILILGLHQVLSSETTATLIGGLAGYLLSGIGKWEPYKEHPPNDELTEPVSDDPDEIETQIEQAKTKLEKTEAQRKIVENRLERLYKKRIKDPFGKPEN
jgi:hypothetical protein